jgi:hypothetical protein
MKKINLLIAMAFLTLPALSFADGFVGLKCTDNTNKEEYKIAMYFSSTSSSYDIVKRIKSTIKGNIYPTYQGQGPAITFERSAPIVTISKGLLGNTTLNLNYKKPQESKARNNSTYKELAIPCEFLSESETKGYREW